MAAEKRLVKNGKKRLVKISIVIPIINELNCIQTTIEHVKKLAVDEVLFVDGGSTDGTAEFITKAALPLISSRPGRGHQLRAGATQATGDALLFLHADNWLHPDSIRQLRELGSRQPGFWGGFKQKIEHPHRTYRWLEWGNQFRAGHLGLVYGDQGLFVSRNYYDKIGGMPDQPIMEDYEISRRLKRIAAPILLPGPHYVSARRWKQYGVLRQTLRNWTLVLRYRWGTSAEQLNANYRRHDHRTE
jgi:rSAM/selenodomain-associated transferase 2